MKKHILFMLCAVLMLVMAVSVVSASGTTEGAPAGGQAATLTIGVSQEAVGLDPHIVTAFSSMRRLDLLYNRLVRLDDTMKVVPIWPNPGRFPTTRPMYSTFARV